MLIKRYGAESYDIIPYIEPFWLDYYQICGGIVLLHFMFYVFQHFFSLYTDAYACVRFAICIVHCCDVILV